MTSVLNRACDWRVFVALVGCLAAVSLSAAPDSDWYARVWSVEEGLPNNNIEAIAQSAQGFLYLGTPIGLASFDGDQFQSYASTNFVHGGQKGVAAMVFSRAGGLWLAMDRGALVYLNGKRTKREMVTRLVVWSHFVVV